MRKSKEEYFSEIAKLTASRSTCLRRQVGAIIVKDGNILSTGYNGAPCGVVHCEIAGCIRERHNIPSGERHELCRGAHAEQNAINHAAKNGVNIKGSVLYCTTYPCSMCAKSIINSGIKEVVYSEGYPDELTKDLFSQSNVNILQML